jgi:hypothetical protein
VSDGLTVTSSLGGFAPPTGCLQRVTVGTQSPAMMSFGHPRMTSCREAPVRPVRHGLTNHQCIMVHRQPALGGALKQPGKRYMEIHRQYMGTWEGCAKKETSLLAWC